MKQYIWIILTAMAFGTMEIALKIGGGVFSTTQMTSLRFLIGGLFLLPFALMDLKKRRLALSKAAGAAGTSSAADASSSANASSSSSAAFLGVLERREIGYIVLLSFINVVISMTLFQLSVTASNATTAAVLISFNPMFTMIFAHFVAGERFTLRKLLILLVCLSGLILVTAPWKLQLGSHAYGIVFGLGASLTFGLYTALSRRCVGRIGGMTLNSFSFILGGMMVLAAALLVGSPEKVVDSATGLPGFRFVPFHLSDMVRGIHLSTLPTLIYVSLVVTGFGYFCFMRAIEQNGASSASYAFFVKPVIAMLLAAAILGEPITWNIVTGILIILAGCSRTASPAPAATPAKSPSASLSAPPSASSSAEVSEVSGANEK